MSLEDFFSLMNRSKYEIQDCQGSDFTSLSKPRKRAKLATPKNNYFRIYWARFKKLFKRRTKWEN